MSWLKEYITDQVRYQLTSLATVKIQHKYNERINKFFIDSRAGLITYKPKSQTDVARFRDKWINTVEELRVKEAKGTLDPFDIFVLYEDIMQEENNISYEANMNTRLKRSWNSVKSKFKIF